MVTVAWIFAFIVGVGVIVWGAEAFAEHLSTAATRMRVSAFALAVLLAGAEPEELATVVTAGVRGSPGIAFGDVIGANIAICLVALGVGACIAPLPFGAKVMRYALLGLPLGAVAAWVAWDGVVGRSEGALLVVLYVLYIAVIWARSVDRHPWARWRNWRRPARTARPNNPGSAGIWRWSWLGSLPWRQGRAFWSRPCNASPRSRSFKPASGSP
jgi:cation:H+ antiporter